MPPSKKIPSSRPTGTDEKLDDIDDGRGNNNLADAARLQVEAEAEVNLAQAEAAGRPPRMSAPRGTSNAS